MPHLKGNVRVLFISFMLINKYARHKHNGQCALLNEMHEKSVYYKFDTIYQPSGNTERISLLFVSCGTMIQFLNAHEKNTLIMKRNSFFTIFVFVFADDVTGRLYELSLGRYLHRFFFCLLRMAIVQRIDDA